MSDPSITPTPENVKQERFEVKLTPSAVIIHWWPWGYQDGNAANYRIVKRMTPARYRVGDGVPSATISGGPAWQQPQPTEWVRDVGRKMRMAADLAERLDAIIQIREDFGDLAVHKEPAQYYLHHPNIIGALTFPLEITTVTDERTKEDR